MKRATATLLLLLTTALATMTAQGVVDIVFNGSSATYNIPDTVSGVAIGKNGAKVTVVSSTTTNEYTFRVSGSTTNGSLTINGQYKMKLELAGLTLTNASNGAAIDIECSKRIDVVLDSGTVNTICDSPKGSHTGAFYIKGHAEFKGKGTLNVTGMKKHAIKVGEYCELKKSAGTINILGAVSDGIHCGEGKVKDTGNYFRMSGGTLNISGVGGDGIDSDDYGVVSIDSGTVSISVPDDAVGLKADSTVSISGGKVIIDVPGQDSKAIRANHAVNISGGENILTVGGDGSKGIKANRYTTGSTVLNGGNLTISGGITDITVTGGNIIATDAKGVADTTKCMGISVDADFLMTDGTVTITTKGNEARTYNVKGEETLDGGTFRLVTITEESGIKGDVNGDGIVDVADISAVINVMAEGTENKSADVNGDALVDVADISAIIYIMANN